MKKSPVLDIVITHAAWKRIPGLQAQLEKTAKLVLLHLPRKFCLPVTAVLLLTNDAEVKRLNRDFRGMNKPTNVLSFPQYEPAALTKMGKAKAEVMLGDIVLGYQYMVDEAKKDNKILINHTIHLLIHGLLHLFGYDHMNDTEAQRMERLEKKIMKKLGLPNPYGHNA